MFNSRRFIAATLLAIGLVELATTLAIRGWPSAAQPVTAPSTEPAKPTSWDIPALVSPTSIAPTADPALAKLFDQHNANQSRIATATLTAQCTWTLDTKGDPRPMTIRYQRTGEKADLTCGQDRCTVEMGHVRMAPGSALNVDALYLLMFRKYDGAQFKPADPKSRGTIRAVSARETLDFDAATGRLVHAEIQAKEGTLVADFGDYGPLKDDPGTVIPKKIDILVPADLYPFYRAADGKISLRIQ